jgi:hypothetical protein
MASPLHSPTGISSRRSTSWCRQLTRTRESAAGALGPRRHRGAGAGRSEVIRTKGSYRFLWHRDDPSRQTVVPVHRYDLPPGTPRLRLFVRYCAKPASAAPSFSIFSEQLPRRFVERCGGCRILLARREASPPPNPPPRGGGLQGEAPCPSP